MPAVLKTVLFTILTALGKTLMAMLTSLMTEKFLKKAIIAGLEKLAVKTKSDLDDQLLKYAKEAWMLADAGSTSGKEGEGNV